MSDFRLSGLATGLDTRALVTQLMAIERRPITLMQRSQAQTRSKIDLYRQINTRLSALQRAAEKVMGMKFNGAVSASGTAADPSKLSATVDATAVSGSYNVNVLALSRKQISGGGVFTGPTSSWTVTDPSKYTPTVGPSAVTGSYNINILNLAREQQTGNGVFNTPTAPTASAGNGNITATSADSSAALGSTTYNLTNIQRFKAQISTGSAATATTINGGSVGTITLTRGTGASVNIAMTTAENTSAKIIAKINAQSTTIGVTASLVGGKVVLTGADSDTFAITGTATTLNRVKLAAPVATQAAAQAQVTIDGVTKTSSTNTFSAAASGLAGVSFDLAAAAPAGSASTLTVTNTVGSLRITNDSDGSFRDVAITAGMTAAAVAAAINGAGSGMTAAVNAGKLTLTGNTKGVTYTVGDAAGGTGLATALGIDSASKTFQTALQAKLSVNGGPAISSTSGDTFTNPIPGVTINALAVGASTLDIVNNTGTIRITKDSDGSFKDIAVASGASASDVMSAINASGSGMLASLSAGKLTLTSNVGGESFTIGDAGGGNAFASSLGIDSATKTTQTAQKASISIDGGAAITGNGNTFTNPITGVTINALALGATTLDVVAGTVVTAQDEAEKKDTIDAIRDMVAQFNDTIQFIKGNSAYDATTKKAGVLAGDVMASGLRNGLTRMFNEVVDDNSLFRTANTAGVQLQRDGTLKLDEAALRKALETDAGKVKTLFTNEDGLSYIDGNGLNVKQNTFGASGSAVVGDGVASRLIAYIDSMVSTASAYNGSDANGIRARGALLGRISTSESTVSDLDNRIEAYSRRLAQREQTLLKKFQAMEKVVAMMRNQGSYMAGQFANAANNG